MKPFLILYFSAVGNTKSVAKLVHKQAKSVGNCEIYSLDEMPDSFDINNYSAIIIGFPTYHSQPAKPMVNFIKSINPNKKIPAFIYTTCGLCSENSLRSFAKICLKNKIIPIHHASYRCSATDGILFAPFVKFLFTPEKNIRVKIEKDFEKFNIKLKSHSKVDVPRIKWYTPINYPNKMIGKNITLSIYLNKDKCTMCGMCKKNCPAKTISIDSGYPIINKDMCLNCYRCIHHCPSMALSLYKNKSVTKVWSDTI